MAIDITRSVRCQHGNSNPVFTVDGQRYMLRVRAVAKNDQRAVIEKLDRKPGEPEQSWVVSQRLIKGPRPAFANLAVFWFLEFPEPEKRAMAERLVEELMGAGLIVLSSGARAL